MQGDAKAITISELYSSKPKTTYKCMYVMKELANSDCNYSNVI